MFLRRRYWSYLERIANGKETPDVFLRRRFFVSIRSPSASYTNSSVVANYFILRKRTKGQAMKHNCGVLPSIRRQTEFLCAKILFDI